MQVFLLAALLMLQSDPVPADYASLFGRGYSHLEAGQLAEAQHDFEAALALRPENANCGYSLACVAAKAGDPGHAAQWLSQAASWGYDDPAVAAWDPDLEALRKAPGWKYLLDAIEMRSRARPKQANKLIFDWRFGSFATALSPDKTRLLCGRGGLGYLYSLADDELIAVLSRHGEDTVHACFTPDGRHILRATGEDKFEVWDGSTGLFLRELEGSGYWQGTLLCGREGTRVVGYGWGPNGGVGVWDLESGKLLRRIPVGRPAVVVISPDASHALIVDDSLHGATTLGIWDLDHGVELARHEDRGSPTFAAEFSSDGSIAYGMSQERRYAAPRRLVLYDGHTGAELRTIDEAGEQINFARFVRGKKELVIQTESGALRWIDTSDGSVKRTVELGKLAWGALAVDPSGHSIFSSRPHRPWDGAGRTEIFDAETGRKLWQRDRPEDKSWLGGGSFSADGTLLTLSSDRGRFEIVEARTGRSVKELGPPALYLEVQTGSDPDTCLVGAVRGSLRRISLSTGKTLASVSAGGAELRSLIASKDGKRLLVVRADGQASVLAAESLEPICDLAAEPGATAGREFETARFSLDGEHLAVRQRDGQFEIWSARTGARELHQELENAESCDLDWSHDGRFLALADGKGSVQLFETRTGATFGPRIKFPAAVNFVRFSPVSERFVVGGGNPVALVFEPGSERPLFELSHQEENIFGELEVGEAAFTPDGKCVVTTTQSDGEVIAWDASDGHRLWKATCGGGNPAPLYARFDRAGTRLCNYGQTRQSPRVFDAKTGSTLVDLGERDYGWLDFSADGKRLLATSGDSLQVLQASDGALLYERVEIAGGDTFVRTESMHVEGPRAALRRVHVIYGGASYPLDGFATQLLDPKRVRAAAAGVRVAPALVPDPPTLTLEVASTKELVASASCAAGVLGFEVEIDGKPLDPSKLRAATKLEDENRRARLDLSLEGLGMRNGARIRIRAVARSGICSRPSFSRSSAG